ncbi:MAG: hypothetical protein K2J77_01170 [Oscillospiraceae bacterium]|nr:hypothetical protein [Oscillospiraceae bacterium]
MNYGLWSIVIICLGAAAIVCQTVYMIITRRRAKRLGILSVKYPVWNGGTAISALIVMMGIFLLIIGVTEINRSLADLANYRAWLSQDPEFYTRYIEKTETALARDRFQLVLIIFITALELLTIFKSGVYITKDGVLFFGGLKPQKTAARIESGAINFYVGKKRQSYAFELPNNEENRALFSEFLTN